MLMHYDEQHSDGDSRNNGKPEGSRLRYLFQCVIDMVGSQAIKHSPYDTPGGIEEEKPRPAHVIGPGQYGC